jgi:hypothetical protein
MTDKQIHIHQPAGHYIGQVRKTGHRLWQTVTDEYRNPEAALLQLAPKMKGMKRGRVLFIDDSGYYEPIVVMEVNRP